MSEFNNDRRELELNPIYYQPENWAQVLVTHCQCPSGKMPLYICPTCGLSFCKECAQIVAGSSACECINCGSLCRSYQEVREQVRYLQEEAMTFGVSDLKIAARYAADIRFTPVLIFTVFIAISILAFPFFMALIVLSYWSVQTIKDVSNGNKHGANAIELTNLLSDISSSVLIGPAIIFISFLPWFLIITLNPPLINLWILLASVWTITYYPIALMVAGITESAISIINPKLGFDTLKQINDISPKLFGIYFILISPTLIFILLFPKEIGLFGFLVFFGIFMGIPFFYSQIILSAVIGRALFKRATRLDLQTNIKR